MATIPIDDTHRIRTVKTMLRLEKKTNSINKKTGEPIYKRINEYPTIECAIQGLYTYSINTCEAEGIIEFQAECRRILTKIVEVFCPKLDIKVK